MVTFWTMASFSSKSLDMKHELYNFFVVEKPLSCVFFFPCSLKAKKSHCTQYFLVVHTVFFWTCDIFLPATTRTQLSFKIWIHAPVTDKIEFSFLTNIMIVRIFVFTSMMFCSDTELVLTNVYIGLPNQFVLT